MLERTRHYQTAGKDALTPRQREVLQMIADGRTNPEIAERLGITLDGAKFHVREILGRLQVDSREEAADWWRANRSLRGRVASWMRAITPAGWLKPTAIGTAIGGTAIGLGAAGFALSGGDPGDAAPLPACELTDLRPEAREGSWAWRGKIFELHLSAVEPCVLEGPAWARVAPPTPTQGLVSSPIYEDVYLEVTRERRHVATATWVNFCQDLEPGTIVQFDLARAADSADGLGPSVATSVQVTEAPECENPNQPSELVVGFEDDDGLPPDCDPRELDLAGPEFAADGVAGTRFVWSIESARLCVLHETYTVSIRGSGIEGILSPPRIDGDPATVEVRQILGVGSNPVIVGTLWNVCDAAGLAMSLTSSQMSVSMARLDVPLPPCVEPGTAGRLSAEWSGSRDASLRQVTPFAGQAVPADYTIHIVQAGENLLQIAGRNGVSVARLLLANPGVTADNLRIGQELRIPSKPE